MSDASCLTDTELIITLRSPSYESGVCREVADRFELLNASNNLNIALINKAFDALGICMADAPDITLLEAARGLRREHDLLLGRYSRCDGNHVLPRCHDPECWQDDEKDQHGPARQLEAALADMRKQRDQWKEFAFKHPELTPPAVTQELVGLRDALKLATAGAKALHDENSDLRALLDEARSHNPEKYRSSSDGSGTHGAEIGDALLPSPSPDWTRVAPSGEGSGQPIIREGWCPHCGATRIEDYSGGAFDPHATIYPPRKEE